MGVYLVSSVETKHLYGIVWGNLDQIWDVVDEVTEPEDVEFAKLGPGGLLSETGGAPHVIDEIDAADAARPSNSDYLPPDLGPSELTSDNILGRHGLVSRIFAAMDAQKGGVA